MKLSGRIQAPPGIIMMMPRVLQDDERARVSSMLEERERGGREGEDALAGDEEVELDDERLERALAKVDEEPAARRPEPGRRVAQHDEGEDGHGAHVRVARVVHKLGLARELERKVAAHGERRDEDGEARPGRPARVVGEAVLLDLEERKRRRHADPDDPHVERLAEPPLAGVPVGPEHRVDDVERLVERAGDLEEARREGRGDDELDEEERRVAVELVAGPERDPDDAEPCEARGANVS